MIDHDWQDPQFAPAGELLKLLVTDGSAKWEPSHRYIMDGPSGEFFPYGMNEPISPTLTVIGWRYAV